MVNKWYTKGANDRCLMALTQSQIFLLIRLGKALLRPPNQGNNDLRKLQPMIHRLLAL